MFNFFERTGGVCAPTEIYWAKQKHNKQKTRVSKKEKVPPATGKKRRAHQLLATGKKRRAHWLLATGKKRRACRLSAMGKKRRGAERRLHCGWWRWLQRRRVEGGGTLGVKWWRIGRWMVGAGMLRAEARRVVEGWYGTEVVQHPTSTACMRPSQFRNPIEGVIDSLLRSDWSNYWHNLVHHAQICI